LGSNQAAADWTRRAERGSLPLLRFMAWLSLAVGRGPSRVVLHAATAYYFAVTPSARNASRDYLRRCLGREPRLAERYAHFMAFATTVHDRLYFLKEGQDTFEIEVLGTEAIPKEGTLLFGAHMGSFEALRDAGIHHGHRRVAMAMYEENARQLNGVLEAVAPDRAHDIIPLGNVGSMIALHERLEAGDLVGVLADRTLGVESTMQVPFLGDDAAFPTGPMRMAAALRQRVFLMAALYLGGNRYRVLFEPLWDFSETSRNRDEAVAEATRAYAARLERLCREAPFNWFNFYDFWRKP